jgi:hypothetical protein
MLSTTELITMPLSASHIEDLKLASSKMSGAKRRAFQAAMTLKYCRGNARQAERVLGWNRDTVELGLHERAAPASRAWGRKRLVAATGCGRRRARR